MNKPLLTAILGLLCLCPQATRASDAWLVSSRSPGRIFLYELDLETGTTLQEFRSFAIEGTPIGTIVDLASAPYLYPNRIWAWQDSRDQLLAIDPYRRELISSTHVDINPRLYGIAMDPSSGDIYGVSELNELYQIDPFTGESSFIGFHDSVVITGLGFDDQGRLLGIDPFQGIVQIDKTSAESAVLLDAIPRIHYEDIAMRPEDGAIFTVTWPAFSEIGENLTDLTIHDLDAGTSTALGVIQTPDGLSANAWGLAFTNVPEPATAVSLLIGLLPLAGGVRSRCSRRVTAA